MKILQKIINLFSRKKPVEFDKFQYAVDRSQSQYDILTAQLDLQKKLHEEGKEEEARDLFLNTITPGMKNFLLSASVMTDFLKI